MALIVSQAEAGPRHTETTFQWPHFNGVSGTETTILVYVAVVDSENVKAASATFSGFPGLDAQAMTLAHEVTAPGTSYPSHHIFSLSNPSFSGILGSGIVEVTFQDTATTINAVSVVVTGVDTGQGVNGLGNFASSVDHVLTSIGEVSGTVTVATGDLVIDCVVANAGLPDNHTPADGQELVIRAPLDANNSAALSLSIKLAINTGETGMVRTNVTSLNTVTSTAMVVFCN